MTITPEPEHEYDWDDYYAGRRPPGWEPPAPWHPVVNFIVGSLVIAAGALAVYQSWALELRP